MIQSCRTGLDRGVSDRPPATVFSTSLHDPPAPEQVPDTAPFLVGYVIEKRFYVRAPPEAKKEINEAGVDIESVADFG